MQHVAIDLGGRESQICVRQANGNISAEKRIATRRLPAFLKELDASRVILETSAEAFGIADAALASGHQVRVVPATLVKTLGVGARGVKTDARDARVLSEVSTRIDLPTVHIPSERSREFRSMCGSREALIGTRTKLINNVRGWLRTQLSRIRSGSTQTFPARVRAQAESGGRPIPEHIERELVVIELLNAQLKLADRQMRTIAGQDAVCRRLMTVPGVGPVTSVRFVAAVDDVNRFRTAHALASYLGLTPGEHSSSERQQRTGITKAGCSPLRRTLVQAAWSAFVRFPMQPMVAWASQIAARRGKFVAVVALARKIAGIMFAIWRDGTSYRPSLSAAVEVPTV